MFSTLPRNVCLINTCIPIDKQAAGLFKGEKANAKKESDHSNS